MTDPYLIGRDAQLACLWEATARKPGNVHRYRDFDDASLVDFLASAVTAGPVLAAAPEHGVGQTVYDGVCRRRAVTPTNTNLGILLLLAPLARAAGPADLRGSLTRVLEELDGPGGVAEARLVYAAIRLAAPGGLGHAAEQDVRDEPTLPLRQVMALAANRDLIARQYANGFQEVFDAGVPALEQGLKETGSLEGAILWCHLSLLAQHPDSLIARKRGPAEAEEATGRARGVLAAGWPHAPAGRQALADFDAWLRGDGHRRNPGTSADLVTACLFVALRQGLVPLPYPWTWSV